MSKTATLIDAQATSSTKPPPPNTPFHYKHTLITSHIQSNTHSAPNTHFTIATHLHGHLGNCDGTLSLGWPSWFCLRVFPIASLFLLTNQSALAVMRHDQHDGCSAIRIQTHARMHLHTHTHAPEVNAHACIVDGWPADAIFTHALVQAAAVRPRV